MTGHREKLNELDEKITENVKFEDGSKAHKFPNPACGKIYVSRDAVFVEEKKWEWCNDNNKLVQNSMEFGILRYVYMKAPLHFFNGDIKEEVYVNQTEGFITKNKEHKVYKLYKDLYGLREAPSAWNTCLNKRIMSLSFMKCSQEQVVYTRNHGEELLIVDVYVDDLIVTGSSIKSADEFKKQMMKEFEMSDLGLLTYYFSIEVDQKKNIIEVKQETYVEKVLKRFAMEDCNSSKYPMETKLQLRKNMEESLVDPKKYKRIIGFVMYLMHTQPDIFYVVGIVSRYMEKPTTLHQHAIKHILRYVKGTTSYMIQLKRGREVEELVGFTDSDLGGDTNDRKNTGGMVFYLNGNLIT
ncbi:uncharacterized mitochondrial protein AtMg00810-like [Impatiens glandulifera]|uniref:uncharacterized mitochondrial protein AtMg00810-like n=1 Tax=Impatiens glandulifera TaxID=253017 RepID=UPI001FB0C6C7|nr:uncharacterized mitochondrial protein AtMg00810-like [Impatiens glandulifera]